jgi:enterochelin esterase family protein
MGGPSVRHDAVCFRVDDPERELQSVRLYQDIHRPRNGPPFDACDGAWELEFPRPQVDRMEYLIEFDGHMAPDPENPLRAPGAFGDKSVIEFPGYAPPTWLNGTGPGGTLIHTSIRSRVLKTELPIILWSSEDADPRAALPLVVAHDGSEYANLASLLSLLARHGPVRAALLDPVIDRDEIYSASATYARALSSEVLPALAYQAPASIRIGMGASLGALAMLHAQTLRPSSFGALFLQSGSFFRQRWDRQESGFPRFRRIARFVGEVLSAQSTPAPIPVTMTCGTVEENLTNNRAVAAALKRQGHEVTLHVNRDAHNYVAWRDCLHPHLTDLLR